MRDRVTGQVRKASADFHWQKVYRVKDGLSRANYGQSMSKLMIFVRISDWSGTIKAGEQPDNGVDCADGMARSRGVIADY